MDINTTFLSLLEGRIQFDIHPVDRKKLLKTFKPKYKDVFADHITHEISASEGDKRPKVKGARIIGHVDNGEDLEALVAKVGSNLKRPDRGQYHVTLSLDKDKGRNPVDSNDIISDLGYKKLRKSIPIRVNTRYID
jgi:hypothetical protein